MGREASNLRDFNTPGTYWPLAKKTAEEQERGLPLTVPEEVEGSPAGSRAPQDAGAIGALAALHCLQQVMQPGDVDAMGGSAAGGSALQDAGATGALPKREEVISRDDVGAAGGRAAQIDDVGAEKKVVQDAMAQEAPGDVPSLLVVWSLESYATAFAELGLQKVSDLKYMEDAHVGELQIPTLAKCKTRAMLEWWREENAAEPARKKVKREEGVKREDGVGRASGGARGGKGEA